MNGNNRKVGVDMKATEFAEFFDLTIRFNSEDNKDYEDYYDTAKYVVWDNMKYYTPRFIDDVSDLTWCVDSMADCYVLADLEDEYGFVYDANWEKKLDERTLYEAAADFATEHNISYADVVRTIAGYEDIEDDVA